MGNYTLNIGGSNVELTKSTNQIAVRPKVGADKGLERELEAMSRRHPMQRRGALGAFEIIEIEADENTVQNERSILRLATSVGEEAAVYHTSDDNVPFVPEGTIYVEFSPGASTEARQSIVDKYALQLVEAEPDGALTVRLTSTDSDAVDVSALLQEEEAGHPQ